MGCCFWIPNSLVWVLAVGSLWVCLLTRVALDWDVGVVWFAYFSFVANLLLFVLLS